MSCICMAILIAPYFIFDVCLYECVSKTNCFIACIVHPHPFFVTSILYSPLSTCIKYSSNIIFKFSIQSTHTQRQTITILSIEIFIFFSFLLLSVCIVLCLVANNNENDGDKDYRSEKQRGRRLRCVVMWLTENRFKKQLMGLRPGLLRCLP